jgi:hypothetical protein
MVEGPAVQADARRVIDWYRLRLSAALHDLAFASCALAAEQEQVGQLRGDVAVVRRELEELQECVRRSAGEAHWLRPEHPDFPGWVMEHWDAIQDARLAHAVEQADRPVAVEQP